MHSVKRHKQEDRNRVFKKLGFKEQDEVEGLLHAKLREKEMKTVNKRKGFSGKSAMMKYMEGRGSSDDNDDCIDDNGRRIRKRFRRGLRHRWQQRVNIAYGKFGGGGGIYKVGQKGAQGLVGNRLMLRLIPLRKEDAEDVARVALEGHKKEEEEIIVADDESEHKLGLVREGEGNGNLSDDSNINLNESGQELDDDVVNLPKMQIRSSQMSEGLDMLLQATEICSQDAEREQALPTDFNDVVKKGRAKDSGTNTEDDDDL